MNRTATASELAVEPGTGRDDQDTRPVTQLPDRPWNADGTTEKTPEDVPHHADADFRYSYLLTLKGPRRGDLFRINVEDVVLGRGGGNGIRVGDPGVSRRHARISRRGLNLLVEDLGSKNGTMLNGRGLLAPSHLLAGDSVGLGTAATFKYVDDDLENEVFEQRRVRLGPRDPVTGTATTDRFLRRLSAEIRLCRSHDLPLALLSFDVDGFPEVSRLLGQVTGEQMLADVAKLTQGNLRREDVLCRWWRETFMALGVGADVEGGFELARRISRVITSHSFLADGRAVPISVSIGVAAIPDPRVLTSDALLSAARSAMAGAKARGPSRIRVF